MSNHHSTSILPPSRICETVAAACRCGWVGPERDSYTAALNDASEHKLVADHDQLVAGGYTSYAEPFGEEETR